MDNKFCVKVHNKYLSEAVQKLAFDNGYKWYGDDSVTKHYNREYIYFGYYGGSDLICSDKLHCDWTCYSALTDWQKIEEAMKPKEPMVIWVNLYDDGVFGCIYDTKEGAINKARKEGKTIKFQEVIE